MSRNYVLNTLVYVEIMQYVINILHNEHTHIHIQVNAEIKFQLLAHKCVVERSY